MTDLTEDHPRSGTPTPRGMLREKAFQSLKTGILHGQLRRGERLSEAWLMREFDIGRTPLREALNRLEREGLVVSQPNSGYSVANLDIDAVCDLLVVREGLDALAAEIAVGTATKDDMRRLAAVMEEIEALDRVHERTPEVYAHELELGLKVHEVILDMTRNPALKEITQRVYDQLRLALWVEVRWIDQWKLAVEEHRAIVTAVMARDADAAVAAARAHIRSSGENMQIIRQINQVRRDDGQRAPMNPKTE